MTTTQKLIPAPLFNLGSGAMAGILGITVVYPVDVVKTRMQSQAGQQLGGAWSCFKNLLKAEGPRGLYKGLLPVLLGVGPEKAMFLATRQALLGLHDDRSTSLALFSSSVGAAVVQSTFINPVEVMKVQAQLSGATGGSNGMLQQVKKLGHQGLFRGYSACLGRDLVFACVYFPLYEVIRTRLGAEPGSASLIQSLAAGVLAGAPAAFLSAPLDTIKTRMQAPGADTSLSFRTVARGALEESALLRGAGPRVARIAPQFGVVLLTFELLQMVGGQER